MVLQASALRCLVSEWHLLKGGVLLRHIKMLGKGTRRLSRDRCRSDVCRRESFWSGALRGGLVSGTIVMLTFSSRWPRAIRELLGTLMGRSHDALRGHRAEGQLARGCCLLSSSLRKS